MKKDNGNISGISYDTNSELILLVYLKYWLANKIKAPSAPNERTGVCSVSIPSFSGEHHYYTIK